MKTIDQLHDLGLSAFDLGRDANGRPWAIHTATGQHFALWISAQKTRFRDQLSLDYRTTHGALPDDRYLVPVVRMLVSTAEAGDPLTQIGDGEPTRSALDAALLEFGINTADSAVSGVRAVLARLEGRDDIWQSKGSLNWLVRDENSRVNIAPISKSRQLGNWAMKGGDIQFYSLDEEGVVTEEFCPDGWAGRVLDWGDFPGVKPIMGMSQIPVVRADGSVAQTNGYDSVSGLYLDLDTDLLDLDIPTKPTKKQLRAAGQTFLDLLAEFPFGQQADTEARKQTSRANALGLLLTIGLRGMYPTMLVPAHAATAGIQGSGKSIIAHNLPALISGDDAPGVGAWPNTDDEVRKRITTEFKYGRRILAFDNLPPNTAIRSAALSAMLTATTWTDRLLGSNTDLTRPNDKIVTLSGNHMKLDRDLLSRTVPIVLDPATDHPAQRTFVRDLADAETRATLRAELITASLTILVGWVQAGQPLAEVVPMRQYTTWAKRVGGMLALLGVEGHLGNLDVLAETGAEEDEGLVFLWQKIAENFVPPTLFTTAQVVDLLTANPAWDEELPTALAVVLERDSSGAISTAKAKQAVGNLFRNHGQYHAGVRVAKVSQSHEGLSRWVVQVAV